MGHEAEDPLHPPIPQTAPVTPPSEHVVLVDDASVPEDEVIRVVGNDGVERTIVLPPVARRAPNRD